MPTVKYSDDVRQHLLFIQGVITRMNSNSFSMKGWMVAIVCALFAVYASNSAADAAYLYIIAALVADVLFFFLDAYYLKMEKEYRNLYVKVSMHPEETDFMMRIDKNDKGLKVSLWKAIKSPSVWILYSAMALLLVGFLIFFV
jgi:hypothetical protein